MQRFAQVGPCGAAVAPHPLERTEAGMRLCIFRIKHQRSTKLTLGSVELPCGHGVFSGSCVVARKCGIGLWPRQNGKQQKRRKDDSKRC